MKRRLLAMLTAVLMLAAMIPTAAFAAEVSESDPYTATVTTVDVDGDFTSYTAAVTVALNDDGTLSNISVSYDDSADEYGENQDYIDYALNGRTRKGVEYTGLISQLSGKTLSEIAAMDDIDAVSGATCSSEAIFEAVQAIAAANTAADDAVEDSAESVEDGYVYVLMNVPYADFYAALDVESVDAVSSATLNKSRTVTQTMAGGAYHVNSDGSDITGITYYVYIAEELLDESLEVTDDTTVSYTVTNRGTESTYGGSGADSLVEAPSYSYYVVDETPSYYLTASADEDGTLSFSFVGEVTETCTDVAFDLTTDTTYGDYQLDLDEETVTAFLGEEYISAVTLTTTDGTVYGLRHVENIWKGYELAWSVGYTTTVHGSTVDSTTYADLEGATISTVTYYTTTGVYVLNLADGGAYCTPYAQGITAVNQTDGTIAISGIPADAENVSVALSYTESKTSYEVEASYADGILTIADVSALPEDTVLTITITADNYAFESIEIEYGYNYVLMNIPYEVFYAALGAENVDGVDAVSAATSSKYNYYNLAAGSYNSGDADIDGVTYVVKLSAADYEAFAALGYTEVTSAAEAVTVISNRVDYDISGIDTLFVQGDYAYAVTAPQDGCLEATVSDGSVVLGEFVYEVTEVTVTYDFYTDTSYGDYQMDLDISDYVSDMLDVSAVTVNTSDGCSYALLHVEEVWTGSKLAWSTGHTTTVHQNVVQYQLYEGMEGKTITSVTYYMTSGTVYEFVLDTAAYVTPYASGVTAELSDDGSYILVSGIPTDAENVSVTLSYTEGSGRNSTTVSVEAAYADGILTPAESLTVLTDYTISISADNYAFEDLTVEVPFADDDGTGDWSWASDYIYALADEGIISGFTDGTYLPSSTLTRAQAAKIIAEAMGLSSEATTSQFTDVSDSHWALTYIEACAEAGIITGVGDGTFNPDGEVTRAQLATMIARALAYDLTDTESSFSDVSGYYVPYIEACVNNGVVNGYGDGTFLPGSSVKRSEAAKMIAVAFGYVAG